MSESMTFEARAAIVFEPKGAVDGTFTEGKHTVSKGVFIARGSAEVSAEGSATVHGFDKAISKVKTMPLFTSVIRLSVR
jgi:hypothetical protein